MRNILFLFLVLFAACKSVPAPAPDEATTSNPLLLNVGDSTVYADEFIYVYSKNNATLETAFTREDVEDYLNLYKNFKLKIREAYARGLDTTDAYLSELETYVAQLKKPYLTSSRITEELVQEAYDRTQEEVKASHILLRIPENPTPSDTMQVYQRMVEIKKQAIQGVPFDSLAIQFSEDPSAKTNKGDLGYFSSMQMVYSFETAAYTTEINELSPIIRTQFGYHVLKVTDRRPAHGKVSVSHIMLRQSADSASIEAQIAEIHDQATGGVDWNELVASYSEDTRSKANGGRLQPFGIGQVPLEFQEAAFALTTKGQISDPVKTPYGWHIIRLEERAELPGLEELRPMIERRISQDDRSSQGREILLSKLKGEWGYNETTGIDYMLKRLSQEKTWLQDSSVFLFSISEEDKYVHDFEQYLQGASSMDAFYEDPFGQYNEFLIETVFGWEEANLEKKYPEFQMLLREYREGILYFQLMEKEIWSPAGADSAGLRTYYEEHRSEYKREAQADARAYAMPDEEAAANFENAWGGADSLERAGVVQQFEAQYDKKLVPVTISWEAKSNSPWEEVPMNPGVYRHHIGDNQYIVEVLAVSVPEIQDFNEIRGAVMADYQKYLEDKWVLELKQKYSVIVNELGEQYVYSKLVR